MNKLAIIIIGIHNSGKSYLINNYIKSKLNMADKRYCRDANGQINHRGLIKSQTLQEARRKIDYLDEFKDLDLLLFPSWPDGHGTPTLSEIKAKLKKLGFGIKIIELENNNPQQVGRDIVKLVKLKLSL